MKIFNFSKMLIFKQMVIANIVLLLFEFFASKNYFGYTLIIINIGCLIYKFYSINVLRVKFDNRELHLDFNKNFKTRSLIIAKGNLKSYFKFKMIGRGLPLKVLVLENIETHQNLEITTFLSGFNTTMILEINNYIESKFLK